MSAPSDDEIIASVAEALPVGIWVARAPGGEFVYANQRFKQIMGMEARDDVAVGEYAEPYQIHGRDGAPYPESRMPFVRVLEERRTVMVDDLVVHRSDGGRVAIRAYASPSFEGDVLTHVTIAFFDITREVEAERARAESEARLQRSQRLESIGNLAGGVAHDFNNLLGAIKAIASAMAATETDPARLEDLRTIDSATDSAASLTRALLGFAGRGKNLSQPCRLDEVVQGVLRILERALDRRFSLDEQLLSRRQVEGDPAQLEQVVMNLVLNARDAMPRGGRIFVRTRDEGDRVVLEVEDEGEGVPAEIRDRIFEPYFTTKGNQTQRAAGLGLATAYGIARAHDGDLWLVEKRRGALFCASFPALPAAAPPGRHEASDEVVQGTGTVLVIEDEPAVRSAVVRSLGIAGYDAVGAADGEQGLEEFAKRRGEIVAVVLDLTMPGMDGRECYVRLRAIDPGVRVLLTTGYALNERAQELLDMGVQGFIAKPFGAASLSAAIARVIG